MKNVKSGFTLLEVILVIAIATLLFMSVVMGIGGRIATGRYETAANEIVDYFRDVYTATLNTENARAETEGKRDYCTLYSATKYTPVDQLTSEASQSERLLALSNGKAFVNGKDDLDAKENYEPGRTDCAIYGKAMYFGDGNTVHIFDVVGNVITNVKEKDNDNNYISDLKRLENVDILEQLEYARADIFAAMPEDPELDNSTCKLSAAGGHTVYEPNWGTLFKTANFEKGDDFVGMVMVVRSPVSGNVQTFFYEKKDPNNFNNISDWEFLENLEQGVDCGPYNADNFPNAEKSSPVQLLLEQEKNKDDNPSEVPENNGFCIGSDDFYVALTGAKKYVEFIPGGQNASAVKLNESDVKEKDDERYNPCL